MIGLDGAGMTRDEIAQIGAGTGAFLDPAGRARAAAVHRDAEAVSATRPVYGRATGVGANREVGVATESGGDPGRPPGYAHALRLLRSHATAAGAPRSRSRVRASLAVRLNQLAAGGSGVRPEILDALARMLAADALPEVLEYGSIGTGDLPVLAGIALGLTGERPCSPPFEQSVEFGSGDALAFLSSNAATIADAALALDGLLVAARAGLAVTALSFIAMSGNIEAFSAPVAAAAPFPGVDRVSVAMRRLVGPPAASRRIQDPYGLRVYPMVHGGFLDAMHRADVTIEAMANAMSENPLYYTDDSGPGVAHHGAFYAAELARNLDSVTAALAQTARLGLTRITELNEPKYTGTSAFLAVGAPGSSGTMMIEYVAAAALGQLQTLAGPVGPLTVTLSRGVESAATFAATAAANAMQAIAAYRVVLACELVCAARAIRVLPVPSVPEWTAGILDRFPSAEMEDRDLTPDIRAADALLGELSGLG